MLKRNLTTLTILAVLFSSGVAMADKGGNNGLHEGQESQQGQQNWQQNFQQNGQQGEDSRRENMLRHQRQSYKQLQGSQNQFKKFIKKPLKQISK